MSGWIVTRPDGMAYGAMGLTEGKGWVEPQFASCFPSEQIAWEVARWFAQQEATVVLPGDVQVKEVGR
jgi:hypothetical protein